MSAIIPPRAEPSAVRRQPKGALESRAPPPRFSGSGTLPTPRPHSVATAGFSRTASKFESSAPPLPIDPENRAGEFLGTRWPAALRRRECRPCTHSAPQRFEISLILLPEILRVVAQHRFDPLLLIVSRDEEQQVGSTWSHVACLADVLVGWQLGTALKR